MESVMGNCAQGVGRLFWLSHGFDLCRSLFDSHPLFLLLGRDLFRPQHRRRPTPVSLDAGAVDLFGAGLVQLDPDTCLELEIRLNADDSVYVSMESSPGNPTIDQSPPGSLLLDRVGQSGIMISEGQQLSVPGVLLDEWIVDRNP